MRTTRRGAFGIGAGALTAGPGLVKDAMESAGTQQDVMPQKDYDVVANAQKVENQAQYLTRRKQELIDAINGKFNGYRLNELNNKDFQEAQAKMNIISLKSVSEAAKHSMCIDLWRKRMIKQWQDEARETLERLLKGEIG